MVFWWWTLWTLIFFTFSTTWSFGKNSIISNFLFGIITLVGSMAHILAFLVITVTFFDALLAVHVGTSAQASGTISAVISKAVLIFIVAISIFAGFAVIVAWMVFWWWTLWTLIFFTFTTTWSFGKNSIIS